MNQDKRKIILILLLVGLVITGATVSSHYQKSSQTIFPNLPKVALKECSKEDYLEDFEYMFSVLANTYPFLEVNKTMNHIDWVAYKDIYRKRIEKCQNDIQFRYAIESILGELNNGHTDIKAENPSDNFSGLSSYIAYKTFQPRKDWRYCISKEYEKDQVRARYNINNESINEFINRREKKYSMDNKAIENLVVQDISNTVAYIKIKSMLSDELVAQDEAILKDYLEKIKDYPVLIIDIRGNSGGSTNYYDSFLYPKLADKEYSTKNYLFIRSDYFPRVNKYYKYKKTSEQDLKNLNFKEEAYKYLKDFGYYGEYEQTLRPDKDSIKFKGKIYLLVDHFVYSASEAMASFSKESGFATLVGEKTGGDGIGHDPMQIALPKTGFVIRYPYFLGLTESGSINELEKTIPDIECDPKSYGELVKEPCIIKILEREGIKP